MKVIAYLRVSTESQAEDGYGLDVQRQGIKRWAREHGHRVVAWYTDEGVSGSNGLDARRGLLDALNALEAGEGRGLVVYRLDRLARKLTVQEGVLGRLWASGCKVWSVDQGEIPEDDPDDPMRSALRQMVGIFAELERGMIRARMAAGRRLKASRGGYIGGAPPFGWRAEAGELVEVPAEQAVIARALELRAEGLSLRAVADRLDAEGLAPRSGGRWHPQSVARLGRKPGSIAVSQPQSGD